jgi:hypothetical protein
MANILVQIFNAVVRRHETKNSNQLDISYQKVRTGELEIDETGTPVTLKSVAGAVEFTGSTELKMLNKKITGLAPGTNPNDAVTFSQLGSATSGAVSYVGSWNAATNSPTLVSGVGTKGQYYVVSVAGSTNIDGISEWKPQDWILFNGTIWEKVDNSEGIVTVNGQDGVVILDTDDIAEGTNNLYFTPTRAQTAVVQNNLASSSILAPSVDAVLAGIKAVKRASVTLQTGFTANNFYSSIFVGGAFDGISTAITDANWETKFPAIVFATGTNAGELVLNNEILTDTSWSWTPGDEIYFGGNGTLTQTAPTGTGASVISAGYALSATTMITNVKFITRYT